MSTDYGQRSLPSTGSDTQSITEPAEVSTYDSFVFHLLSFIFRLLSLVNKKKREPNPFTCL